MSSEGISSRMPQRTSLMGFQIWSLVGICMGVLLIIVLAITLCFWIFLRSYESKNKKKTTTNNKKKRRFRSSNISNNGLSPLEDSCSIFPTSPIDICVDKATPASNGRVLLSITDSSSVDGLPEKVLLHLGISRKLYSNGSNKGASRGSRRDTHMDMSMPPLGGSRSEIKKVEIEEDSESSFWQSKAGRGAGSGGCITPRDFSLGWGHWYSLQELEDATHGFSHENVIGEGGYGVVYKGQLVNGTIIAVKYLLNNVGEAEKEFQAEVETIGRVKHKNLVHLLGYCIERRHCFLVYEFIDNGNLEQWLHGALGKDAPLTWEARIRIALGTSKGLQYLHEALEPKVVHRDIKSSNILVDKQWNSKVSDFGLAKILESEKSHVSTRVMGTFGYVAPEYASTGLLNEQSDVYSFGVLLVEIITGRDPIDYSRPTEEVNLVDWLKAMVRTQRSEEILDPRIEVKPPVRVLKRLLLIALHCLDPVSEKRPKMGHVVHMLEAEEFPREFGYYRGSTKERDQSRTNNEIPEGSLQHILKQDSALHYVHEDLDEDDEKGQTKNHGI